MIDIYDSEAIIKFYKLLNSKCEIIDKFINNHALYFGPCTAEYGAEDVCNNIIELMTRKNQLINIKIIVDSALNKLSEQDRKILYLKINYKITMSEFCGILNVKERTAFRQIERAYENFAQELNKSKYRDKLIKFLNQEEWIGIIVKEVKERRQAYKLKEAISSL